jgi:hypothetical protein
MSHAASREQRNAHGRVNETHQSYCAPAHMNDAYRKVYFDKLGLISLLDQHRRLQHAA